MGLINTLVYGEAIYFCDKRGFLEMVEATVKDSARPNPGIPVVLLEFLIQSDGDAVESTTLPRNMSRWQAREQRI